MIDNNKQNTPGETMANVAPSRGRRRLVKGAMLATPAVMTLMSGRLMAATSMTCSDKAGVPEAGWIDVDGNVLDYGPSGSEYEFTLGYYDDGGLDDEGNSTRNFIPSHPAAPSASCLISLYPSY